MNFKRECKDIFITVTQAANFLNLSKEEVKKIADQGILTKYGDNGYRYALSMKEVNRVHRKMKK